MSSQVASAAQKGKLINLIPVGLKEAALDSPTFRATSIHFGEQVDLIEKWLEDYLKATTRLMSESAALEQVVSSFIAHTVLPETITEAVLDHDYGILSMNKCSEGAKDFWAATIGSIKRLNATVVAPIRSFLQNDLRAFKDVRKSLEVYQKTIDSLHTKYASLSKTKDPSFLREEAFQLHGAQKSYLKASMDFCIFAPQLRNSIDKLLIGIFTDQWREMRVARANTAGNFARDSQEMERARGWLKEMGESDKAFRRELYAARKQLEDTAELAIRPSRDLEDYSASTLPYLGHGSSNSAANIPRSPRKELNKKFEKQGWLYLRTYSGKPLRTVWIRRWAFVKNGIFGWLIQSNRPGGVEESERIGVLLCNIKPASQEERRFCFEVKTKNNTIVLQADNQAELLEWVNVFDNAKTKALEDPGSTDSGGSARTGHPDPAFAILPPAVPEFGTTVLDSVNPNSRDDDPAGLDRSSTASTLGPDPSGDLSRRGTAAGFEGGGLRDHAARAMSKVDLPRRAPSGNMSGLPGSPALGGIASLIAASHGSMPVGPGAPVKVQEPEKPKLTFTLAPRDLPPSTLAPSTLANPPAPTQFSKQAVVISGERGIGSLADSSGGIPNGLLANMWGSFNWAYLNRIETGEVKNPAESNRLEHPSPMMLPSNSPPKGPLASVAEGGLTPLTSSSAPDLTIRDDKGRTRIPSPGKILREAEANKTQWPSMTAPEYPNYYPLQLKTQNAQFRLLFPSVRNDEKLVLVFRATWNPNDQQDFPGRAYVTTRGLYFYSNHLGLVLASTICLANIEDITAAPGRDCDFLFLHMRTTKDDNSANRITIKTFLEPLKVLQRRLNYLARNSVADHPSELEDVIKTLIKMEVVRARQNSDSESWEDVSINTPMEDGVTRGNSRSKQVDLRASVRIDNSLEAQVDRYGQPKEAPKFKLPAQPVVYTPAGNLHLAAEKKFDVSPKALFHVLFGDKSAVWQLLQHERRAKNLTQGPWISMGEGHLRRDFEFEIPVSDWYDRASTVEVRDYQVVDVLTDHLCYVVTDKRTAWHLPFRRNFKIVSKIVITHQAKSKSKLAIFTKVEWVRRPWLLKGMIDGHAMDDLELDALDLIDLATDQVRRLGPHSRTKKAVQIFGQVGQSTSITRLQLEKTALNIETRRQPNQRTFFTLLSQATVSLFESTLTSLLGIIISIFRWIWKTCSANSIILLLLITSALFNGFYSSRDSWSWWHERSATNFLSRVGIQANAVMGKAIYLHDIDEMAIPSISSLVEDGGVLVDNPCYATFRDSRSLDDLNAPLPPPSSPESQSRDQIESRRIQQTRRKLATYRHDLLVSMRVVNSIEREVLQAEWEGWVLGENRKCRLLDLLLEKRNQSESDSGMGDWRGLGGKMEGYCDSCRGEQMRVLGRV